LLRLLDERVQNDDTPAKHEAVERAADTGAPARAQLEQSGAERPRMRQAKTRAMLGKQLNQARIVSKNVYRPRLDFGAHAFVEVLNLERHASMLANALTTRK
jgi:hypothetical protein